MAQSFHELNQNFGMTVSNEEVQQVLNIQVVNDLLEAIKTDKEEIVHQLVKKINLALEKKLQNSELILKLIKENSVNLLKASRLKFKIQERILGLHGLDISTKETHETSHEILYFAVIYKQSEIIKLIVQIDPKLCVASKSDVSDNCMPLHEAVSRSNLEITEIFLAALSKTDPELIKTCNSIGWTILHHAVDKSDQPMAKLILNYAPSLISIQIQNQFASDTALMHTIRKCSFSKEGISFSDLDLGMCELLLQFNPKAARDINKNNRSVLNYAVSVRSIQAVKLLLKYDADIVKIDPVIKGKSNLLEIAFYNGDEEMVDLLMSIHPKIIQSTFSHTDYDCSLLDLARKSTRSKLVALAKEIEIDKKGKLESHLLPKYRIARQASHLLGLSGCISLKRPKEQGDKERVVAEQCLRFFPLEGNFGGTVEFPKLLASLLEKYCAYLTHRDVNFDEQESKRAFEYFNQINEAFRKTTEYLSFEENAEIGVKKLLEHSKNKILILPISTEGHVFAIGIYKDNFIVCDRIDRDNPQRIKIYKINSSHICPESILALTTRGSRGKYKSSEEFLEILNKITENKSPYAFLSPKFQKHATCGFINLKSLIEGFLYLLEKEYIEHSNPIKQGQDTPENNLQVIELNIKKFSEIQYKRFTSFIKNDEVNDRIMEYRIIKQKLQSLNIEQSPKEIELLGEDLIFYEELLASIVKSHHGQPATRSTGDIERRFVLRAQKVEQEMERALRILAELSSESQAGILEQFRTKKDSDVFLKHFQCSKAAKYK